METTTISNIKYTFKKISEIKNKIQFHFKAKTRSKYQELSDEEQEEINANN